MLAFDTAELDKFQQSVLDMAHEDFPKETGKFLRNEASGLRKVTLATAKRLVRAKTGNYHKSIKRGKLYRYSGTGDLAIRAYSGAPHAHLLENGHRLILPNGQEAGFVPGKHVFEQAAKEYEKTYYKNAGKFAEDILERGIEG